jgi:ATP-dependent DNA helicase RecQ
LELGSELILRARSDGQIGWELADLNGVAVTRMAQAFTPPKGKIIEVRVAAISVRHKTAGNTENLRCEHWEVVLPEIIYLPRANVRKT